jgi:restriction system protein
LGFYHEITPGDVVIARRGLKSLAAIGDVASTAFYAPGKSPLHMHPSFMEIAWRNEPRNLNYPTLTFLRPTVVEISEKKYQKLRQSEASPPDALEPNDEIEDPNEFVLKKYLEDFIVSNFDAIFKGALKIYEETEEGEGQQYDTNEIGRIDILATEPSTNGYVVIELKKGRSSDRVVGQTLRYMGWVKKNLFTEGQPIRGLIICRDHNCKLTYAIEMIENMSVRYYSISFKLTETP